MPSILNNVATAAGYTDAATCTFLSPARKVNFTILNAAAYCQYLLAGPNGTPDGRFSDEEILIPGAYSRIDPGNKYGSPEVAGVRFRSVAATPAAIIANAT